MLGTCACVSPAHNSHAVCCATAGDCLISHLGCCHWSSRWRPNSRPDWQAHILGLGGYALHSGVSDDGSCTVDPSPNSGPSASWPWNWSCICDSPNVHCRSVCSSCSGKGSDRKRPRHHRYARCTCTAHDTDYSIGDHDQPCVKTCS